MLSGISLTEANTTAATMESSTSPASELLTSCCHHRWYCHSCSSNPCLPAARHPRGASFVRPSKVSFGVDYLKAVQEAYGSDVQEAVTEASSNNVDLRLKEVRYVFAVLVSGVSVRLAPTDDIILPQQ